MQHTIRRLVLICLAASGIAAGIAFAQDGGEQSRFVRMLEGMLSAPGRTVSLRGLEGIFSSSPRVGEIVVSDNAGPWLRIRGVEVGWNRSALFRRTLDIDSLAAAEVTVLRRPESAPSREGSSGRGGGSPVDIVVDRFALPAITFADEVVPGGAQLSAEGSASVRHSAVTAMLHATRHDRAGELSTEFRLQPAENVLDANVSLEEPAGGLLADFLRLQGRPALAIRLTGSGALEDWRAELAMEADGAPVLDGEIAVARSAARYDVTADLVANLGNVVPPDYAALLAGRAELKLDAGFGAGDADIRSLSVESEGIALSANARLGVGYAPESADISLTLGSAGRATLPFVPGEVSLASLTIKGGLDTGAGPRPWRVDIDAEGIESAYGVVADLAIAASGQAENLTDSAARSLTFRIDGTAEGVGASDGEIATAIGSSIRLAAGGAWSAGQPLRLEPVQAILNGASVSFVGTLAERQLAGRFAASITNLARIAFLLDRPLAGRAELSADGTIGIVGPTLDLALDATTTDLGLGISSLDPLLAGATRIGGRVVRNTEGIRLDPLTIDNEAANASISGTIAGPDIALAVNAALADLSRLNPRASGGASLTAQLSGTTGAPHIDATATGDRVVLMDRPLSDASARFSGTVAGPETAGEATIAARLGSVPIAGSARLSAAADGGRLIDNLVVTAGDSRAAGSLSLHPGGLLSGKLTIASPDLSAVAPLFLVEAGGMLRADVALVPVDGKQSARFSATATDLVYESVSLRSAELSGTAADLFGAPQIDGTFSARQLVAGGLVVTSASGTAERRGSATAFTLDANLADGSARLAGALSPASGGLSLRLDSATLTRAGTTLALSAPTTLGIAGGGVRIPATRISAGGGAATISGTAGQRLDLRVDIAGLPAAFVNTFSPSLGAEGTIAGTATITGAAANPAARFDLTWRGASVAAARNAGIGPLAVTATGNLAERRLTLDTNITGADGLSLHVGGSVGTAGTRPLDLTVAGAVPLSLGNRPLASRGAALQGGLDVNIRITGPAAAPQFAGSINADGGGFVDPRSGIVLSDLSLRSTIANNRLAVERLSARSGEGTVNASGSIGLAAGFPLDLKITVRQARYVDGTLLAARLDADLTVSGALATGPRLAGRVFLDRTEITVPESLPRDSVAVDVRHIDPSQAVAATVAKARGDAPEDGGSAGRGIVLDLTISAPQQIFVRGRGLDAELGGELRLTGATSAIVATGGFQLVRGRFDILTQRVVFDRGALTFAGDLDPILDFSGTVQSAGITVTVTVTGNASDPAVNFSSVPELPQDEVLARLIFNKGIGDLSPVQIARLANAAIELSGGSGGGLLGALRKSTGLDDLDIVTDAEGAPALAAGRYINENVYLGFQQGATAESSRVSIDLDITGDVKARATASPSGDTSIGVFFEHEY